MLDCFVVIDFIVVSLDVAVFEVVGFDEAEVVGFDVVEEVDLIVVGVVDLFVVDVVALDLVEVVGLDVVEVVGLDVVEEVDLIVVDGVDLDVLIGLEKVALDVVLLIVVALDEAELPTVVFDVLDVIVVGTSVGVDEAVRMLDKALSTGFEPPLQFPRKSSMLISHTMPPPSPFDIM